ncbi:MAG TPA: DinB family protein, partial [Anaerolineales bacterium]|nr:DinB family protein [Anaerolineales bacterium]
MQLKEYLEQLYDYNYWANKRYLAVAETLTEEQLFLKQGHSWDSVHAVLVHMMSSERMWPQRWRGETGTFLDAKDFPTMTSIRDYWVDVEKAMRSFLAEQSEGSLLQDVSYTNPRG